MAIFHVCQVAPNSKLHVLAGYREVIETIVWGLNNIGHSATSATNELKPAATNIIFGAHYIGLEQLKSLGPNTILYNLEQIYGLYNQPLEGENLIRFKEVFDWAAENITIWDYSRRNVETVKAAIPHANIHYVPISYAPVLTRIAKPETQDIDVLFVGMPHPFRVELFQELGQKWFSSVFVCGLYGEGRDGLIGRSKIVLNVTGGAADAIFPIVRASYLLANRKLVIADLAPNLDIEPDMPDAVQFTAREHIIEVCNHFLTHDADRDIMENRGFSIFSRRDIRDVLATALADRFGASASSIPTEKEQ